MQFSCLLSNLEQKKFSFDVEQNSFHSSLLRFCYNMEKNLTNCGGDVINVMKDIQCMHIV